MSGVGSVANRISECCSVLYDSQLYSSESKIDSIIQIHIDSYTALLKCFSDAVANYEATSEKDNNDRHDCIGSILPILIADLSLIDEFQFVSQSQLQTALQSPIDQLLICAMDVLSWICNGDVVYPLRNSNLNDSFKANCTEGQIQTLSLKIMKCISVGSLGVKLSALFLLVEQHFPLLYISVVDTLMSVLSEMVTAKNPDIIRKNALKCMGRICKQIRSDESDKLIIQPSLDLPPQLMSNIYSCLTSSTQVISGLCVHEVLPHLDVFKSIDQIVVENTQQLTIYLQ